MCYQILLAKDLGKISGRAGEKGSSLKLRFSAKPVMKPFKAPAALLETS
jgi:hypothetical protein